MPRLALVKLSYSSKWLQKASILLVTLVVVFALLVRDSTDPYKCHSLLNDGHWIDSPSPRVSRRPFQKWQSPGCFLHEYTADDIRRCAGDRKMIFAGDTSTRQIFWATAKKIDREQANNAARMAAKHGNITFESRGVRLEFLWDPFLNSSGLTRELEFYQKFSIGDKNAASGEDANRTAAMILLGGGLWHARQYDVGAVRRFKDQVEIITGYTKASTSVETLSPLLAGNEGTGDLVFMAPLEDPLYGVLSPSRKTTILPEEIDQMNGYLHQLTPRDGLIVPWVYETMVSGHRWAYEESGLHVIDPVAARRADVLLNARCNAKLDRTYGAPFERTCCSNYAADTVAQRLLIGASAWAMLLSIPAILKFLLNGQQSDEGKQSEIASALQLALIVAYCFTTDRTHIFTKAHKLYGRGDFLILCALPLVLGALMLRNSFQPSPSPKQHKQSDCKESTVFLHDDMIRELKGWMVAILIIYNWTGAEVDLRAYELSRVLAAGVIFLVGFRLAAHIDTRNNFTTTYLLTQLIRYNLLSLCLAYMQGTTALSYHFGPLISLWLIAGFCALRIAPRSNVELHRLAFKIVLSCGAVAVLHRTPGSAVFVITAFRVVFNTHWDPEAWRNTVLQDQYVFGVGMLAGVLRTWIDTTLHAPSSALTTRPEELFRRAFPVLKPLAIIAALALLPAWWALTARSPDAADYDWWNAGISPVPVLALVVLRNASRALRSHHSAPLAWLGARWLEMYALSLHALSAADGRGVLRLGLWDADGDGTLLGDRWRELTVFVPVLLVLAEMARDATARIAEWVVGGPEEHMSEVDAGALPLHDRAAMKKASPGDVRWRSKRTGSGGIWASRGARVSTLFGVLWALSWLS